MKKIFCFSLLMFFCTVLVGCVKFSYNFLPNLTKYYLDVEFNDETKSLNCKQEIDYINTSNNSLKFVNFHLYANAFRKNSNTNVISQANYNRAYPNGESYGEILISCVKVGDSIANYNIKGDDENILEIYLLQDLFPDEKVEIYMEYTVNLANVNHRLGYGENAINLCNFYPIACVYENNSFVCDLYNANGDPFYSEVSDYDVIIKYPKDYILANSGNVVEMGENYSKIEAKCVRDFGAVLSKKFNIETIDKGEYKLNYYFYDDENYNENVEIISKSMVFFEKNIGKYPYSQISVVKTNFVHGGMEYPNMVLISDEITDELTYKTVIVHELAHQWWYGVVGNNEFEYGWIDEGLTEFSTVLFFENHRDYGLSLESMVNASTQNYLTFMKVYENVQGEIDTSMNRALDEFATEPEYVYNTYVKGMLMFATIYQLVGEKSFANAMKYYYTKNLYKIATPNIVIRCFSVGSGKNLESLFNAWLQGKVKIIAK